jgi:hypothetical protein
MKNYISILSIFFIGGFALQIIPYITKGDPIDWPTALSRYGILVILSIFFWLFFFGGIQYLKELECKKNNDDDSN